MVLLKEHKEVLLQYIAAFPTRWKQMIRKDWDSPLCVHTLRAIRNAYGPSWLDKQTAVKIQNAETR